MRHLFVIICIISTSLFTHLAAPEVSKTDYPTTENIRSFDVSLTSFLTHEDTNKVKEPPGRWITVIATAYSPNDEIDSGHHHCKDDFTASMTRISKNPYGVAVPMRRDRLGRSTIPIIADYGTEIYIPSGYGYLDNSRKEDRIFVCDDTGGFINRNTRITGIPHIDLRFKSEYAAKKFGKKKIEIFVYE